MALKDIPFSSSCLYHSRTQSSIEILTLITATTNKYYRIWINSCQLPLLLFKNQMRSTHTPYVRHNWIFYLHQIINYSSTFEFETFFNPLLFLLHHRIEPSPPFHQTPISTHYTVISFNLSIDQGRSFHIYFDYYNHH